MPSFSSAVQTTQPYIPLIPANQRVRVPGMPQHFATVAAMNAAIADERANIASGIPVWLNGTRLTNDEEPAARTWLLDTLGADDAAKAAASHARKCTFGTLGFTVDSDSSMVRIASGIPPNGVGTNGDWAADVGTGALYKRTSGAWAILAGTGAVDAEGKFGPEVGASALVSVPLRVKADGVALYSASSTASINSVVGDNTASFTSADVGKACVLIPYTDTGLTARYGTITAVNGPTSVTTSLNGSPGALTGATFIYGTDYSAAIDAVLAQAASLKTRATVQFPDGIICTTKAHTQPSGVSISGRSNNSTGGKAKDFRHFGTSLVLCAYVASGPFLQPGTLGNGSPIGTSISDINIDCANLAGRCYDGSGSGRTNHPQRVTMVRGTAETYVSGPTDRTANCVFLGANQSNPVQVSGDSNFGPNNIITGAGNGNYGVKCSNPHDVLIFANHIWKDGGASSMLGGSVWVSFNSGFATGGNVTVLGNKCDTNYGSAMKVSVTGGAEARSVKLIGNDCFNNDNVANGTGSVIELQVDPGCKLYGLLVGHNTASASWSDKTKGQWKYLIDFSKVAPGTLTGFKDAGNVADGCAQMYSPMADGSMYVPQLDGSLIVTPAGVQVASPAPALSAVRADIVLGGDARYGDGDSTTAGGSAIGETSMSAVAWGNYTLPNNRLRVLSNKAASGSLIEGGGNDLIGTQLAQMLATGASIGMDGSGINHLNPAVDASAPTVAQIVAMRKRFLDIASRLFHVYIVQSIDPLGSAAEVSAGGGTLTGAAPRRADIPLINAAVRDLCATYPNVLFLDTYSVLQDPAAPAGTAKAGMMQTRDGIHQTTRGAAACRYRVAELFASIPRRPAYRVSKYTALPNFMFNGGTKIANSGTITGDVAANMSLIVASGSAAVTASLANGVQTLVIDNSAGGAVSAVQFRLADAAAYLGTLANGDTLSASVRMAVRNPLSVYRTNLALQLNPNGTTINIEALGKSAQEDGAGDPFPVWPTEDYTLNLVTRPYTLAVALASIQHAVTIEVAAGGSVTVDLSNPMIVALAAA